MNTTKIRFFAGFLLVMALLFSGCSATKKTAGNAFLGNWEFLVTGAPQGDVKGIMEITKAETGLKGVLKMPDGNQTPVKGLTITKNALTGSFDYSDMSIDMNGTFEGDKYTGTVSAQGYTFPMTATKKK